jgi:DNA-binding transcriptional LysR family regulator
VAAVPAAHALAQRRLVPVEALEGEPLILPARHGGEGLYERVTRLLAEHEVTPQIVQGDIWMMQTVVGLVAAGIGLAVVPESAQAIRPGEVAYKRLAGQIDPVPLVAVWRADEELPVVRRFLGKWGQVAEPEP